MDELWLIRKPNANDLAVWRWQEGVWGTDDPEPKLSLEECEQFAFEILSREGLVSQRGIVRILDGRGCSDARTNASGIWLPKWARCREVVAHELVHWIVGTEFKHGHEFLKMYSKFLMLYLGYTWDQITESAKQFNISF